MRDQSPHARKLPRLLAAALLLTLAWLAASPASAGYREQCWVRFRLASANWSRSFGVSGWSPIYAVTCNYWTGAELNQRSRGKSYQGSRTYVVIAFRGSARRIIRIAESTGCLFEADPGCAETLSRVLHGRDEDVSYRRGREIRRDWLICQPGLGKSCDEE